MAEYTPNYNLYKPNGQDDEPVTSTLASNFQIIDEEIKRKEDGINSLSGGLSTLQTHIDERANSLQEQVDNLIVSGDSSLAVEQALAGTPFTTLREKHESIDTLLEEKATKLEFGTMSDFKAPGLNLVAKVINEFTGRGINPEWFGLSDSAADNYQAVIDTFNHIKLLGGGRVVFPQGKVFKFTRPLGVHNISNIDIDLNGSKLDFSGAATNISSTLLGFEGVVDRSKSIVNSPNRGTTFLGANTSGLAVGDLVKIHSNKIWDPARTSSRIGELNFIKSIDSSTTMNVTNALKSTYLSADAATLLRILPVRNVVIRNGELLGPSGNDQLYGVTFNMAMDCLIYNIKSKDIDKRHVVITDSTRCNVINCHFKESYHETQAYGVSFVDATMNCICSDCYFDEVRHSLSTNNNVGTSYGIVRNILFKGNIITNSAPNIGDGSGGDAIDSHAGSEDIMIINNIVDGSSSSGINFEARSGIISGNRTLNTRNTGIYVNPRADTPSSIIVANNMVKTFIGDGGGSDYGINIHLNTANGVDYVIQGNVIESDNQAIKITAEAAYRFESPVISGNKTKVTVSSYAVQVENANSPSISGNTCIAPSLGIFIKSSSNGTIGSNTVSIIGSGTNSWGIRLDSGTTYTVTHGNSLKYTGSHTGSVQGISLSTTDVNYNGVFSNVTQGFATAVANATGTNLAANNI